MGHDCLTSHSKPRGAAYDRLYGIGKHIHRLLTCLSVASHCRRFSSDRLQPAESIQVTSATLSAFTDVLIGSVWFGSVSCGRSGLLACPRCAADKQPGPGPCGFRHIRIHIDRALQNRDMECNLSSTMQSVKPSPHQGHCLSVHDEESYQVSSTALHFCLCLAECASMYSAVPSVQTSTRMGAVERAILEAYRPCKGHRSLLWELGRSVLLPCSPEGEAI